MNKEKKYKEKIESLHFQLEDVTKNIHKESEKLEAILDNKKNASEKILAFKKIEKSKIKIIENLDIIIEEKKDKAKNLLEPKKAEYKKLCENIENILFQSKGAHKEIIKMYEAKEKFKKINLNIDNGRIILKSLKEVMKDENKKHLKLLGKNEKMNEQIDKREKVINEKLLKLKNDKKSFNDLKKSFSFYARRFLRIYRKKNLPINPKVADLINNLK